MHADDLCDSERVVWDAFPRAETVDFRTATASGHGTPGGNQAVRADVIAALLLGARTPETGRVPAVRLSGARIAGQLDLSFAEVGFAVLLRDCVFDEEPRLYGASTRLVNLSRSRLPGLQLSDAQIDGLLWLEGCRFDGPVRLTGARIAQTLSLQRRFRCAEFRPVMSVDHCGERPVRIWLIRVDDCEECGVGP